MSSYWFANKYPNKCIRTFCFVNINLCHRTDSWTLHFVLLSILFNSHKAVLFYLGHIRFMRANLFVKWYFRPVNRLRLFMTVPRVRILDISGELNVLMSSSKSLTTVTKIYGSRSFTRSMNRKGNEQFNTQVAVFRKRRHLTLLMRQLPTKGENSVRFT